jgi:hypothetical protein
MYSVPAASDKVPDEGISLPIVGAAYCKLLVCMSLLFQIYRVQSLIYGVMRHFVNDDRGERKGQSTSVCNTVPVSVSTCNIDARLVAFPI